MELQQHHDCFRDQGPSNTKLRIAKYGYIVLSILICVLGVVLLAVPGLTQYTFCWVCGILLILFGCVKIIGYLSRDLYRLAFQFDLAFGIFLIVLGMMIIRHSSSVSHIISIFLGIIVLADSLLKIQIAIDSKSFGIHNWWLVLMVAICTGVFGFLLLFRSTEVQSIRLVILGISLLGEGVLNLITVLTVVKILEIKLPNQDVKTITNI